MDHSRPLTVNIQKITLKQNLGEKDEPKLMLHFLYVENYFVKEEGPEGLVHG